jgi:uncharacterized membrane protein
MSQGQRTVPDVQHAASAMAGRAGRVERVISTLLRCGVISSLVIIVLGTLLSFAHHRDYASSPLELARLTRPGAAFPHTLAEVADGARRLRGQAITTIGLLVLLATPVARVAVSILAFLYERDRVFVVLTATVLLLLLLSFVLGRAGG